MTLPRLACGVSLCAGRSCTGYSREHGLFCSLIDRMSLSALLLHAVERAGHRCGHGLGLDAEDLGARPARGSEGGATVQIVARAVSGSAHHHPRDGACLHTVTLISPTRWRCSDPIFAVEGGALRVALILDAFLLPCASDLVARPATGTGAAIRALSSHSSINRIAVCPLPTTPWRRADPPVALNFLADAFRWKHVNVMTEASRIPQVFHRSHFAIAERLQGYSSNTQRHATRNDLCEQLAAALLGVAALLGAAINELLLCA